MVTPRKPLKRRLTYTPHSAKKARTMPAAQKMLNTKVRRLLAGRKGTVIALTGTNAVNAQINAPDVFPATPYFVPMFIPAGGADDVDERHINWISLDAMFSSYRPTRYGAMDATTGAGTLSPLQARVRIFWDYHAEGAINGSGSARTAGYFLSDPTDIMSKEVISEDNSSNDFVCLYDKYMLLGTNDAGANGNQRYLRARIKVNKQQKISASAPGTAWDYRYITKGQPYLMIQMEGGTNATLDCGSCHILPNSVRVNHSY